MDTGILYSDIHDNSLFHRPKSDHATLTQLNTGQYPY